MNLRKNAKVRGQASTRHVGQLANVGLVNKSFRAVVAGLCGDCRAVIHDMTGVGQIISTYILSRDYESSNVVKFLIERISVGMARPKEQMCTGAPTSKIVSRRNGKLLPGTRTHIARHHSWLEFGETVN